MTLSQRLPGRTLYSTVTVSHQSTAYTNMCPDGHACDNDASCVESLFEETKYVCDCEDAYQQTGRVYAGMSCQHVATEYCTATGELSQTSFCVNEGTCKEKVSATEPHPGCTCSKDYTGEHCQYIVGSVPLAESYFMDGTTYAGFWQLTDTEGPGINPAAIVLPILFVVFAALGYFLWKYRGLPLKGHLIDKTKKADENMLEANGSDSMSDHAHIRGSWKGRRNSTPAFSSTHKAALMDPPDFEDLLEQSDHVKFHMDPTGTAAHKLYASDPTLNYIPTTSTSGSGEDPYNCTGGYTEEYGYNEEYDLSQPQAVFEEYDPKDFAAQDAATKDPTLT